MTGNNLSAYNGLKGYVLVRPGLYAVGTVKDARRAYGALQFLVTVADGRGEAWLASNGFLRYLYEADQKGG